MKASLPRRTSPSSSPPGRTRTSTSASWRRGRQTTLRSSRRPTLSHRHDSPWHRPQQNLEGHDRQVQEHGGPLCAVRARMGLPRSADRDPGRKGTRRKEKGPSCGLSQTLPRFRHPLCGAAQERFQAPRVFGRLNDPYLTMNLATKPPRHAFLDFMEKGYVYRGRKPVYWCLHDQTALAEAEVEYEDHTSPSIWVAFKVVGGGSGTRQNPEMKSPPSSGPLRPGRIPHNRDLAFHPDFEYVVVDTEKGKLLLAADRVAALQSECDIKQAQESALVSKAATSKDEIPASIFAASGPGCPCRVRHARPR